MPHGKWKTFWEVGFSLQVQFNAVGAFLQDLILIHYFTKIYQKIQATQDQLPCIPPRRQSTPRRERWMTNSGMLHGLDQRAPRR